MTGLVTGTQAGLQSYRATQRLMKFRTALTQALVDPKLNLKAVTVKISNSDVLCSMRGDYAPLQADATYIASVTTTLNKFATPPTIATIGDAFTSVFQNYTIDASTGKMTPASAPAVTKKCQEDLDAWPASYYGAAINPGGPKAGLALGGIGTALSTFGDLYNLLDSILTPIVTGAASALASARRAEQITAYLENPQIQKNLLNAATDLALAGNALAQQTRLQALGQFAEKMTAARSLTVDLSKTAVCTKAFGAAQTAAASAAPTAAAAVVAAPAAAAPATAAPAPAAPVTAAAAPAPANSSVSTFDGVTYIPSDDFVACYVQAWGQLNDAATAAVTAAGQYDSLADPSSDQLMTAVDVISKNIDDLKKPATFDPTQLVNAATQLMAYAQAVGQALSPANLTKVQTDVDSLSKMFK